MHYLDYGVICDANFLATVISYTCVYYYGRIVYSTYSEPEFYIPQFKLNPVNGFWFSHFVKYIILALMLGLYVLIIFWTLMICKVIYRLVSNTGITDIRSDDEDESDEIEPTPVNTNDNHLLLPKFKGKR